MEYTPNLRKKYNEEILDKLVKKFKYKSAMQAPKLLKICVNQGVGEAVNDKKLVDSAVEEMSAITGQRAVPTLSRLDISNFKLRANMPIGARVTLRGNRMWEFLERLISVTLPRVRDFQGIRPSSFDGRGNYTLGILEHIVFTEIDIDKTPDIHGMDITFVTSTNSNKAARALLKELGLPFADKEKVDKEAEAEAAAALEAAEEAKAEAKEELGELAEGTPKKVEEDEEPQAGSPQAGAETNKGGDSDKKKQEDKPDKTNE